MIFALLFLLLATLTIANVMYFLVLQRTMNAIRPDFRPFPAAMIWFALVPLLGLPWQMIYMVMLSVGLRKELRLRELADDGALCITLVTIGLTLLCLFSPFFMVPAVAMWIVHWIRISGYRRILAGPPPPQSDQDWHRLTH